MASEFDYDAALDAAVAAAKAAGDVLMGRFRPPASEPAAAARSWIMVVTGS